MSHTRSTLCGALCLAAAAAAYSPAFACGPRDMANMREKALALDATTVARAEELLRCKSGVDEAALWLGFYLNARGEYERLGDILERAGITGTVAGTRVSEREAALASATSGRPAPLAKLVDDGRPGYADDAEVLLVLARAETRAHDYERGRIRYDRYLNLKHDDDEIRVERSYALVWKGDMGDACGEFRTILAGHPSASAAQAARAGAQHACKIAADGDTAGAGIPLPRFGLTAESLDTSDGYRRRSFGAEWQGKFATVDLLEHKISDNSAAELTAKHHYRLGDVEAGGSVGAYSGSSRSLFEYDLDARWSVADPLNLSAGVAASPLAKYVSLEATDSGALDEMIWAGFALRSYFRYRFESHVILPYSRYRVQEAWVTLPLLDAPGMDRVELLMHGRYAEYPRQISIVFSPFRESRTAAGFVYTKGIGDVGTQSGGNPWRSLRASVEGGRIEVRQTAASTKTIPLSLFAATAEAVYMPDVSREVSVGVEFFKTDNAELKSRYDSLDVKCSVNWLLGAAPAAEGRR